MKAVGLIQSQDLEFYQAAAKINFKHAKLSAGSTRRANNPPAEDKILSDLLKTHTPVVTLGKSWTYTPGKSKVSLAENLQMIEDSTPFFAKMAGRLF